MSITSKAVRSLRKVDTFNQKSLATGFTNLLFAHKSPGSESGITLTSMTSPSVSEMPNYVAPSASEISAAHLGIYWKNLVLMSNVRGILMPGVNFTCPTASRITFNGFVSQASEIFVGIVNKSQMAGTLVADIDARPVTGIVAAGGTDFPTGYPFEVGKYIDSQVGSVVVFVGGNLYFRNQGNSPSGVGDYYEVPGSAGLGNIIRFNTAFDTDAIVAVIPTLGLAIAPSSSLMAQIENLQGKLDIIIPDLAAATGNPESRYQTPSPSNVDLLSMGNAVYALRAAFYKNLAFTAEVNKRYSVDTSAGAVAVTLPALPNIMECVEFEDAKGTWDVNNLAVASALIQGVTQTYTMNMQGLVRFRYIDATYGWNVYKLVP